MGGVGEEVEATVFYEQQFKESFLNLETSSANVRTMGEAGVLSEGTSGTTEELYEKMLMLPKIWIQKQMLILN